MATITLTNQSASPIQVGRTLFPVNVPTTANLTGTDLEIAEIYRDSGLAAMSVVLPPVVIEPPAITGTPAVGETLTGDLGDWGGDAAEFSNVWQISANGTSGWADIAGATGATYAPVAGDATKFVRLSVEAENAAGTITAVSAPVGPVEAAA